MAVNSWLNMKCPLKLAVVLTFSLLICFCHPSEAVWRRKGMRGMRGKKGMHKGRRIPKGGNQLPANPTFRVRLYNLVSSMTLEEKIGQMTQVDARYVLRDPRDLAKYGIGSILTGGESPTPNGRRTSSAADWAIFTGNFQRAALKSRLKIPLIYGVDAVHGHNKIYGATIYPHNIGIGATRDPSLAERIGAAVARDLRATGMNWNFAPNLGVCRDPRWGRCYESFGENTALVTNMTSMVTGLQGRPRNGFRDRGAKVAACAKHFVGDGGTTNGVEQGDNRLPRAELERIHLRPYVEAVKRGVYTIMVAYNSWNGVKMSGHFELLTRTLKGRLGFQGVLVSDWAAVRIMAKDYRNNIKTAINAGIDMVMVPDDYKTFITLALSLVRSGEIPMSRIDDAVRRILTLKHKLGLFARPFASQGQIAAFNLPSNDALARVAVRKSLVLLKNQRRSGGGRLLPLKKSGLSFLVAGAHADNIGLQCGGWTINWQGSSGPITRGTTVLNAVRRAVTLGTAVSFVHSPGPTVSRHSAAIVVVGEQPYAEGYGDDRDLRLSPGDEKTITNVCARMPCVVVLISGRPLVIEHLLGKVDAFVAAWLPGTEGRGITDVLFGDFPFTGRLPQTWFRTVAQLPMNMGDKDYDPLFPYGFGLR